MGDPKESEDVEEGMVDAYMDVAGVEAPSDKEKLKYLKDRYEGIKAEYKTLSLNKMELEGRGEKNMHKIHDAFRENYKARKWCVSELRNAGIDMDDPFIKKG